jgi:hypothetical protein
MPYDAPVPEDVDDDDDWGILGFLTVFLAPPFIILLPLVLLALIAFWIYVWITRNRRPSSR